MFHLFVSKLLGYKLQTLAFLRIAEIVSLPEEKVCCNCKKKKKNEMKLPAIANKFSITGKLVDGCLISKNKVAPRSTKSGNLK